MTYATLRIAQAITRSEGARSVAGHYFVRLPSGRWCRTWGVPQGCAHVRGRVYSSKGGD